MSEDQEKTWKTYAIAGMGTIVIAVSGLWINGVLNSIELVRKGLEQKSEEDRRACGEKIEIVRKALEQKSEEDRRTYNDKIDAIRDELGRMYSDFGTVRNEQMQRTSRLTSLEAKIDIVIPTMEKRIGTVEAEMANLKRR